MGSSVFLKIIRSWIIGMILKMMLPDPKPNILRHMQISEVDVRQTIWNQHEQWPCKNNIPLVSYWKNALIISVRVSCAKKTGLVDLRTDFHYHTPNNTGGIFHYHPVWLLYGQSFFFVCPGNFCMITCWARMNLGPNSVTWVGNLVIQHC